MKKHCLMSLHLILATLPRASTQISLYTNPIIWDITETGQKGMLGFQAQPKQGIASSLAIDISGSYSSGIEKPTTQLTRHFTSSIIGIHVQIFPWGARRLLTDKKTATSCPLFNNGWGCHGRSKRTRNKRTDPLAGIWVGPGYEWRRSEFLYVISPSIPTPKPEYWYRLRDRAVTLQAGYQIQLWHFLLGASYGLALSQPYWEGNGPNIFEDNNRTESALLLQTELQFQLGISF